MKILVFSDSHGNEDNMIRAVERERPFTLDAIVHLGDGWRDAEALHRLYPRIPLEQVPGNCDFFTSAPPSLTISLDGVRIFLTHGHLFGVKSGLTRLALEARRVGAQLALFGHTHEADFLRMGDVTLFNPGSAGMGRQTYGMITVKGTEFKCEILSL